MTEFTSLAELSADTFQTLIGSGFRVFYPEHQESLTLERMERRNGPPGERDPFSLFLRGESTTIMLNQGIHTVAHDALGNLELFVVPVGRDDAGRHEYQVVFS